MPKTPTQLGSTDGSVTALLPVVRDYSDDFVRRTELPESARQEYKAAWYEAFRETRAAFRIGGGVQWGVVVEVKPTNYGVELVVERVMDDFHDTPGLGYWEGARIDHHERGGRRVLCP